MNEHDVSVRPHLTYGVHTHSRHFGAKQLAQHLSLDQANELAHYLHSGMGENAARLTQQYHTINNVPMDEVPANLHGVLTRLLEHPKGTFLMVGLTPQSTSEDGQEQGRQLTIETIAPREQPAHKKRSPLDTAAAQIKTVSSSLGDIRNTIREVLLEEQTKIHLPETWDDLSRETSKRGLEAFMMLQAATQNIRKDHEIEALVSAIAKRTGKAQSELRVTFEKAQARATAFTMPHIAKLRNGARAGEIVDAVRAHARHVGADLSLSAVMEAVVALTHRGEASVRAFVQQALAAEAETSVTTVDMSGTTTEFDAAARSIRSAQELEQEQERLRLEALTRHRQGSQRLENATQEFFALNVGFYGMTAEAAAQQMSLPLPTADDLRRMPAVIARIDYFKRCHAQGDVVS